MHKEGEGWLEGRAGEPEEQARALRTANDGLVDTMGDYGALVMFVCLVIGGGSPDGALRWIAWAGGAMFLVSRIWKYGWARRRS